MTPEQRAQEIVDAIEKIEKSQISPLCLEVIAAALWAGERRARNEALEEAAQLLLKEAKDLNDGPGYYGEEIQDYERLADALRSLKEGT